ncbi:MAG: hypothetical protein WAO20_12170 [Acidobacteriota bacterium]
MLKKTVVLTAVLAVLFAGAMAGVTKKSNGVGDISLLSRTVADGPHPRVFLNTNSVVYTPGQDPAQIRLTATIDPNGNTSPRVFFVYLSNQATGEIRYIDNTGLLAAGVVKAIDGSVPGNFTQTDVTPLSEAVLLGPQGLVGPALNVADLDTGNYQLVLDLREGSGQRSVVFGYFNFAVVDSIVEVPGDVTQDTTWTSNNAYFINDRAIFVRQPATLMIDAGTVILGTGQNSALVVDRGAKIRSMGTRARPVVMTSANPPGERNRADWGGLILNGRAPINTGEQAGEGDTGLFGGDDPHDSSGELHYTRVEFAGIEFSPENELNGIAFQGVGDGTVVDHIQIHMNKDDSVEFFGGTAKVKYVVSTRSGDDNLDWVLGWRGAAQFVCAQEYGDDADNGIEADNLATSNDLEPISSPQIYNVTFVGDPDNSHGTSGGRGVLLREGTAGLLRNLVVIGFRQSAVDVDDIATVDRINGILGNLTFKNSLFYNNCTHPGANVPCTGTTGAAQFSNESDQVVNNKEDLGSFTTANWMTSEPTNRSTVDPLLRDPYSFFPPDFRPQLNSPVLNRNYVAIPPDDGFFTTDVDYIGCMGPTDDWTQGWTYFGAN